MTTVINTKHILHYSNFENPVYPKQAKNKIPSKVEVDETIFDEATGKYKFELSNNGIVEVCSGCGKLQPMNDEAMKLYDSSLVEEIDNYEWDNNKCETRHKPFDFNLPVEVEYLEPEGLKEEYIKLKDSTNPVEVKRLDEITGKIKRLIKKDLMNEFKEFEGFVGKT